MNPSKELTFESLKEAVSGSAAAFRCRVKLQPVGGEGTKVFPPTYADAKYATEYRRLPGKDEPVPCVLLDSVQSQANRMEEALQEAVDSERISLPIIQVDFSNCEGLLSPVGTITSLQAPHRIADAILRDSLLDGCEFRKSETGKCLDHVSLQNATPLYQLCPTALLFGMWDSTGPKGGLGAKFQRAIVSEIVGIDAVFGVKTSSRIDPLQIAKNAGPVYEANDGGWTLDEGEAKKIKGKSSKVGKDGKPSEVNHGNIVPSISNIDSKSGNPIAGGVTIAYGEQVTTISLPALRRLQFPVDDNSTQNQETNMHGRIVLTALGLCAAALATEHGLDLRSRCLLWPTEPLVWELLDKPGIEPQQFIVTADNAIELLAQAVTEASQAGLTWQDDPVTLTPTNNLAKLVAKSQKLLSEGNVEEGE